jgi:hypothetical protein
MPFAIVGSSKRNAVVYRGYRIGSRLFDHLVGAVEIGRRQSRSPRCEFVLAERPHRPASTTNPGIVVYTSAYDTRLAASAGYNLALSAAAARY